MVSHSFDIGGLRFAVRTTSKWFGRWVAEVLAGYRVESEETTRYSVIVPEASPRKGLTGLYVLYDRNQTLVRSVDAASLAYGFVGEIERLLASERDDLLFLQAVALRKEGATVLLPGELLSTLARQRRKLQREWVRIPLMRWVAVDPSNGNLVPPSWLLGPPRELIGPFLGANGSSNGVHFVVEQPIKVDVAGFWTDPVEASGALSKARVLHGFAGRALNMPKVGSDAVFALAKTFEGATCFGIEPKDQSNLLDWIRSNINEMRS